MQAKQYYRQQIRTARKNLSATYRQEAEKKVANALLNKLTKAPQKIGIYLAYGSELDLSFFIQQAINKKHRLFAPFIHEGERLLHFTPYPSNSMIDTSQHGIAQYQGTLHTLPELDVLIMPLLGIDAHGYRLGQGGGYYDTTLAACSPQQCPQLIGVGFDCQIIEETPKEAHDMAIDAFISESKNWQFNLNKTR